MKRFYKVVRAVLMTLVALAIFLPAALYIVLSTDWAQDKLRRIAEDELSKKLGSEVVIGSVDFSPFNRVDIGDVHIADDYGKTALTARNIEARFEFWNFVTTGRLAFDYAVLQGLDAHLYRLTPDSPLNIADIIENLKSKEPDKEPAKFDLALYTVRIEDARFRYDVLSEPLRDNKFDPNHIEATHLTLMATAPRLSNDEISAKIRRLSFIDKSGLDVTNLRFEARYTPKSLDVNDISLNLPGSFLNLGSYNFTFENPKDLECLFKEIPVDVSILKGSYFSVNDFGWALPSIAGVDRRFNIETDITASANRIALKMLDINEVTDGGFFLKATAVVDKPLNRDSLNIEALDIDLSTYTPSVTDLFRRLEHPLSSKTAAMLNRLGRVDLSATAAGGLSGIRASFSVNTSIGSAEAEGALSTSDGFRSLDAEGQATVTNFDLGYLLGNEKLGTVSTTLNGSVKTRPGLRPIVDVQLADTRVGFNGHDFHDVEADFNLDSDGAFFGGLKAYVDGAALLAEINGQTHNPCPSLAGNVTLSHFNPNALGLIDKYPGYELDFDLDFDLKGVKARWIDGYANLSNISFRSADDSGIVIRKINITADNTVRPNVLSVSSDFLNGSVEGDVSLLNVIDQIKTILSPMMPAIIPMPSDRFAGQNLRDNNFSFDFVLDNADNLVNFLHLPISVIHPVEIEGSMNFDDREIIMGIDAPYLMKGDMIIENTSVQARLGGASQTGNLYLTTQFPTKKGEMVLIGGITAHDNVFGTELDWRIERDKPIEGKFAFDTELSRDVDTDALGVTARFLPCDIRFGNDRWKLSPSTITYRPGMLDVDHFSLASASQAITINGMCSVDDPDSEILVSLDKVVLNAIFETLDINKALIGGVATGTFHASSIFSGSPVLECRHLHVDNIGYNNCVLGNGDLVARWDNDHKSFFLDAVVTADDGRKSYIKGDIFPATESLDISFRADRVKVGFMKPFIDAFASDIKGYASGWARIFGTFKYIDMEGDILAEDLGIKIDFTNTWYYATDSIHMRPGLIDVPKVTIRDAEGHTAQLNGVVKHTYFKDPVFDFRVTDAKNFLSYDVTPKLSPDWYGRIYGNGSAFITGSPGVVNIDVNMATADGSTFTFVLSDLEEAEQYNFLTFRDKNREVITDSIIQVDILPKAVREYRDRARAKALAQNPPSAYNMDIQVDITPAAKIILVMDPVGGDEIKSWGKGSLRMTYASKGNDLRMYGTYTIDRGSYNFTLQDIIVKDFTIKDGSSISFTGDPYNAALDITAYYALNANLTDLDESFMNDAELNRTNVPVRALLLIRGDMRQPDIDFDLEFPTLTSDIYRKVRSIISTDEMMNRQMIYLLALNHFYTPEYMTATKGSELFSVASSTISSRLSSMLGKLSENWRIAPNLRSDKGDFSDVEFDLALSSNLLNNRLRLNGNFGYRDKSLNTNQFIGDFDLEYLINRSGTWRLKAYNRFNDQTYFLRTAKTTQGVGVKFQRDFDNMFSFLRRKKKSATDTVPTPSPTDLPVPNDSVTIKPVGEEKITVP